MTGSGRPVQGIAPFWGLSLVLLLGSGHVASLAAQLQAPDLGPVRVASWPADVAVAPQSTGSSLGREVVSSLVIPGAGQWMQGRRRWLAYLAVEATAVLFTLERRRAGASFRDSYRDLAWNEARQGTAVGRMDLDFPYYESISSYTSSGAFDADPVLAGVQPETDPATFNGRIWELASGIFLGGVENPSPTDAGYAEALNYYKERSYGDQFLWDWSDRSEARTEYRRLISESDEAFRTGTVLLGVAVANHLVSAIDAFIAARGSTLSLADHLDIDWTPSQARQGGMSSALQLRVRLPR